MPRFYFQGMNEILKSSTAALDKGQYFPSTDYLYGFLCNCDNKQDTYFNRVSLNSCDSRLLKHNSAIRKT